MRIKTWNIEAMTGYKPITTIVWVYRIWFEN